jgi:hypothetical protein
MTTLYLNQKPVGGLTNADLNGVINITKQFNKRQNFLTGI